VPIHILGVNGSLRQGSTAHRALRLALRVLEANGARCETFEVGSLPLHDGRSDEDYPASVAAWRAACNAADALIVTVPSYHGGMPGGLKNAFDLVDTPHMGGKPFALVGIAGGDAEPGVTDTARVLRHIGGIAAVPDVVISRSREHWGDGEEPRNKAVVIALEKVATDLIAVCALRAAGQLPVP
jgi:NAD(P)H-dependent FMN reductase